MFCLLRLCITLRELWASKELKNMLNLGSLLQVYCKEGNFGFQLLFIEEIRLIWLKSRN